jgi:hypothetical protein
MALGNAPARFPADANGNGVSVLQAIPGLTTEWAVATTGGTEHQVHNSTTAQFIRLFAIGCDCYYNYGPTGLAAPDVTSVLVPTGAVYDTYLLPGQQYIRALAKTGSGFFRVELLA